ncbi:hypothetical protein GQ53DRAFT_752844 [Thozetella sp. PMI_491]|nr:hypothetical protein GQ53DRAFT_752844 [Thozetella sp. PMI_491]
MPAPGLCLAFWPGGSSGTRDIAPPSPGYPVPFFLNPQSQVLSLEPVRMRASLSPQ